MMKGTGVLRGGILVAAGICLAVVSCDLLSSKPEIDVEKAIDEAVRVANAPVVNVEVARTMVGISNPVGSLAGIKQGVPFKLNFSVNPNFGFIRWTASLGGVALEREAVEFSAPDQLETQVTVRINPGTKKILITPLGEGANDAGGFTVFPVDGDGLVDKNHYFRIQFTKPLDYASLRVNGYDAYSGEYKNAWSNYNGSDGATYITNGVFDPSGYNGQFSVRFNNLHVRGSVFPPFGYAGFYLENFFYPPVLSADGTILTLWSRLDDTGDPYLNKTVYSGLWGGTSGDNIVMDIMVYGSMRDSSGLSMGTAKKFSYRIKKQNHPPVEQNPPAYGSSAGNMLPNMGYTGTYALLAETGEDLSALSAGALAERLFDPKNFDGGYPVIPLNTQKDLYVVFQANVTQWPVSGVRLLRAASGSNFNSTSHIDNFSLLGEKAFYNAPDTEKRQRDLLTAAYKLKNPSYTGSVPIYTARLRIPSSAAAGDVNFAFYPIVPGEPVFSPSGNIGLVSFGTYLNRQPYGSMTIEAPVRIFAVTYGN